jgi:hypothetical protein
MLTPREGSPSLTRRLTIHRIGEREIHVFGAGSPHTAAEPFVVRLVDVRSTLDILDRMTDVACRGWRATPADLLALAELLLEHLEARRTAS